MKGFFNPNKQEAYIQNNNGLYTHKKKKHFYTRDLEEEIGMCLRKLSASGSFLDGQLITPGKKIEKVI